MRRVLKGMVLLAVVLAGVHLLITPLPELFGFGAERPAAVAPSTADEEEDAVTVQVAPVKAGRVTREVSAVGTLRASQSVVVRPEIAGRIAEILFEDGHSVEKGQPLVVLDASVLQAQLEQSQATLAMRQANAKRSSALLTQGAGSAQARDEARSALSSDEAAVKLAEAQLARTALYAPFAGRLGFRQVDVGAYVSPGQDIVALENVASLKVEFRVPQIYLAQVRPGQPVRLRADAFPGRSFEAKVTATEAAVEESGRSLQVQAVTANPDEALRPGQFVTVDLVLEEKPDALLVPEAALVPQGGRQYVFRLADGKASRTEVTLGVRQGPEVEVTQGLAAGDTVVTAGQEKLRDGTPVRVQAPQQAEQPAAPAASPPS